MRHVRGPLFLQTPISAFRGPSFMHYSVGINSSGYGISILSELIYKESRYYDVPRQVYV